MSTAGFSAFLARKNIKPSAKLYFVDAMSAMAMGLFASLLIGTILDTLGDQFHWDWLHRRRLRQQRHRYRHCRCHRCFSLRTPAGPVFSLRRGTRLLLSRRPTGGILRCHCRRGTWKSRQPRN